MINSVEKPNLPQGRVTLAAISAEAGEAIEKLNAAGVKTVKIPRRPQFPSLISSHADLRLFHAGKNILYTYGERTFGRERLENFQIRKIASSPSENYPGCVGLNCALIGNKLICNKKTAAPEILEFAESLGYKIINVRQGYTRCSICVVCENAIITDDESIFAAAGNFFDDVTYVSKGSVGLEGYEYGFIGGCCGKIDKDALAFNGSLESHKDYKLIADCLSRNGVRAVELRKGRLCDVGGVLPLREESPGS